MSPPARSTPWPQHGILTLLRTTVDTTGQTVVMVTHDPVAASYVHCVVFLADGRIVDVAPNLSPEQITRRMTGLGAPA